MELFFYLYIVEFVSGDLTFGSNALHTVEQLWVCSSVLVVSVENILIPGMQYDVKFDKHVSDQLKNMLHIIQFARMFAMLLCAMYNITSNCDFVWTFMLRTFVWKVENNRRVNAFPLLQSSKNNTLLPKLANRNLATPYRDNQSQQPILSHINHRNFGYQFNLPLCLPTTDGGWREKNDTFLYLRRLFDAHKTVCVCVCVFPPKILIRCTETHST